MRRNDFFQGGQLDLPCLQYWFYTHKYCAHFGAGDHKTPDKIEEMAIIILGYFSIYPLENTFWVLARTASSRGS